MKTKRRARPHVHKNVGFWALPAQQRCCVCNQTITNRQKYRTNEGIRHVNCHESDRIVGNRRDSNHETNA